jgi:hypothetical protein
MDIVKFMYTKRMISYSFIDNILALKMVTYSSLELLSLDRAQDILLSVFADPL